MYFDVEWMKKYRCIQTDSASVSFFFLWKVNEMHILYDSFFQKSNLTIESNLELKPINRTASNFNPKLDCDYQDII